MIEEALFCRRNRQDRWAHRSENWLKSDSRSHILRPLRAAFAEYTGPMPFFVVPKLEEAKGAGEEKENSVKEVPQLSCVQVDDLREEQPCLMPRVQQKGFKCQEKCK